MKKNGWRNHEYCISCVQNIIVQFSLFKEVLNEIKSRKDKLYSVDAIISYSQNDLFLAEYVRLLLNTSGFTAEIKERSDSKSILACLNRPSLLTAYFLLIPSTYGKVLSKEGLDFRREIEILADQRSKLKLIITYGGDTDERLVEMLSCDLKGLSLQDVNILNIGPAHETLVSSANKLRNSTMPHNIFEPVTEIMTPVDKLNKVLMSATVADVYFKITVGGARQCIVIDSNKSLQCLRVISIRDLASKVPPGLMKITDQVREKYEIELDSNSIIEEVDRVCQESVEKAFGGKQENLISIKEDTTILEVIELLTRKHDVRKDKDPIYISGFPVLSEKNKLVGFVSYLEIIEKVIEDQTKFLTDRKTIADVVALIPEKRIATLDAQATLGVAKLQMDGKGYRSLPVVSLISNDLEEQDSLSCYVLKGFVDDICLGKYSYKTFINQLGNLAIEGIMTPVERLCIAESSGSLKSFIRNFYEPGEGELPTSTFVVCDSSEVNAESVYLLRGTLSYIDILKAWQEWFTLENKKKKS
jgi:CBS domain-containing protein